tara:strand:- start:391 stop:618 length:228 start_codon:yes stop_codon:yes gene_type:complete
MNRLPYFDQEKAYLSFEFYVNGKTFKVDNEYEFDVTWTEVLDDVIRAMEASFGYSLDLSKSIEKLGIHKQGKTKK